MTYDQELYDKVMGKLKFEPGLDALDILIAIKDKGVVVLGGKVKSYAEKYIAEEAVKKVGDVYAVVNELEVEVALPYQITDAEIAEMAVNALRSDIFVPDEKIKITVSQRHLTLSGEVEFYFQKEHAAKAVRNIIGIVSITNNIIVKPTIQPSDVKEKIMKEFERNARIDAGSNIEVEVNGSEVALKGKVRNFDEAKEAENAVWAIPGITKVRNLLTINR